VIVQESLKSHKIYYQFNVELGKKEKSFFIVISKVGISSIKSKSFSFMAILYNLFPCQMPFNGVRE
jgi:hypothetical protein